MNEPVSSRWLLQKLPFAYLYKNDHPLMELLPSAEDPLLHPDLYHINTDRTVTPSSGSVLKLSSHKLLRPPGSLFLSTFRSEILSALLPFTYAAHIQPHLILLHLITLKTFYKQYK
jgi:hypothetical protein